MLCITNSISVPSKPTDDNLDGISLPPNSEIINFHATSPEIEEFPLFVKQWKQTKKLNDWWKIGIAIGKMVFSHYSVISSTNFQADKKSNTVK